MTRLAGKLTAAVVALAAFAPAPALAQPVNPGHVAGHNFVGGQVDTSTDPAKQINLLSMRVVDGGASVNVWLDSGPASCGGMSDLAVGKVPIDKDGAFHAKLQFGEASAPHGTATVDGVFTKTKRRGTVARTTVRSHFTSPRTCDMGPVKITAIRPKQGHRGAGEPAPNALFVGITAQTSQRIDVRLPMLALISPSGTQVKRIFADTNVACTSGRQYGGVFRIRDIDIKNNSFNGLTGDQEPIGKTGGKRTILVSGKGTFHNRRLEGTWHVHEVDTDSKGAVTDDCDTGDIGYFAARVR